MTNTKLRRKEINALRQGAEELHNQDKDYRSANNKDFILYILIVLLIAVSIRVFIGEPIRVQGDSMYPTLFDTERMIVEKLSYYVKAPERGDIIVCFYPGYTVSCVKRVIGLPGDKVEVKEGKIYVNDQPLDEGQYWRDIINRQMPARVVAEKHVFVVGDNRNHSGDSRDPEIGDIPYKKIVGKAVCVIWPLENMRAIHHVDYPA